MEILRSKTDNKYSTAEGICLRRLDYSNTSQVVSFLTPHYGRVDCMYKGAWRAPQKGISTGVDLAERYKIDYRHSASGGLDTLNDCAMIEHFGGLRTSVDRALCAYYAIELMRNFTTYAQDCSDLYTILLKSIRCFASGINLGFNVLRLEAATLIHYGSYPDFSRCSHCGKHDSECDIYSFSAFQAGLLCKECHIQLKGRMNENPIRINPRVTDFIDKIPQNLETALSESNVKLIVASSRLLRYHISWLLGKHLAMWKYLHSRHYSRTLSKIKRSSSIG